MLHEHGYLSPNCRIVTSSCLPQPAALGTHPFFSPPPLQAGALTGIGASFAEGPIEFYKSQLQIQRIRQQTSPAYKGEGLLGAAVPPGPQGNAHQPARGG